MDALLSVSRASELLGISHWTVRKYISINKLHPIRIGRRTLLELREVQRLIDEGRDYVPAYRSPGAGQ
jgi:excisionase family DNA binding protein